MTDTIFALSTVVGKSGVAVFRISGARALEALDSFGVKRLEANRAAFARLKHPKTGEVIDEVIVLYFKAPHSFTGEDIVEIHNHGSIAVINEMTRALNEISFLRLAERGEFSKRAFSNGKMDLTKAEGLADLIEAQTSRQHKLSMDQLSGAHEGYYENLRRGVINILARLEALIDYPDDDLPIGVLGQTNQEVGEVIEKIALHLKQSDIGRIIQRGVNVAILGHPNVGKSSLLNAIAKQDIAIVSEIAGTTRDVVSVKIELKGYAVNFHDTAGIRETEDVIEQEGIKKAFKVRDAADIKIYIIDPTNLKSQDIIEGVEVDEANFIISNKADLKAYNDPKVLNISTLSGENIDVLMERIFNFIASQLNQGDDPIITRERYRKHLSDALEHLHHFNLDLPLDISTEYIRLAVSEIGKITGKVNIEEILDEIFSSFCIGK